MASGGCCCRHVSSMHSSHCHTPPMAYSPHGPSPLIHPTGPPTTSLGCGGMGGGGASHVLSLDYNIAPGGGQLESGYSPHAGGDGGGGGGFYGTSPSPHGNSARSLRQYPELPTSYSRGLADSMLVHQDMDSHQQRALPSYRPATRSLEMEGGGGEEPTPLHTGIARGQGLLSGPGCETLSMEVVTDTGDDTPSTSMEDLSSSDSSSRFSSMPLNVTRQVSEECNAKQPYVATATSPQARPAYGGREGREGAAAWGVAAGGEGSGGGQANAFGSAKGGGNYGNKDSQSSLKQLERLSQLPPCFKPDQKYTTMVAEQQVEEVSPGQRGSGRVHIKRERDSNHACHFPTLDGAHGGGSGGGGKARGAAGADTFPLRVKPQTGGATVDQVRSRQPGTLTKTTSVPIDMKVEEFKKGGWRRRWDLR